MSHSIPIITTDSPEHAVLRKKTTDVLSHEWPMAREIGEKLYLALQPYFPSAGLSAPQIGILKSVFIFSYDRDPQHLETVINPRFEPIANHLVEGWEGCLSTLLCSKDRKFARLPRYEKIHVHYLNLEGHAVEKTLDGFAAKVFQHEWDHLQGLLNIDKPDTFVKTFQTKEEMESFMRDVKKDDSSQYKAPH